MLSKIYITILAITLIFTSFSIAQTYQGPITINVPSGAIVNTGSFIDNQVTDNNKVNDRNIIYPYSEPLIINGDGTVLSETVYIEDSPVIKRPNGIGENSMLLKKWNVQQSNNVIPPDPTVAVGPNHVMALSNDGSGIRIYDKAGNLLKLINSTQWWSAVWPSQSGDPQIIYDHYSQRWVMVFMQIDDIALTAGDLIAYSDDSDPIGTWYMYRLPNNLWGDFPQIGFDEEAIYIATNNFTFGSLGQYAKIRIISKAELYASNGGALSFKEIWNITIPGLGNSIFNIRPSFQYSPAGGHYFLFANRTGANFYSLYKMINPTTTPSLTGVNISIPFYGQSPNANQLGGGTPLIESGGSVIRTAPIFRDGFLYAVHSIRNSIYPNYSSIKYFKIDVNTNTIVENAELGANNYYYIYPAVSVDKDGNVGITCSRSADNEYMGAYYTTRRFNDPPGLGPSKELQAGLGNYIKTFSDTRNRWGDYMGMFLDPADEYSFWMFTEYASTGNNYAISTGQVRLKPFSGIFVYPQVHNYDFGNVEVGIPSDTISALLSNYGTDDFIVSDIPLAIGDFTRVSSHSFPITIQTFDTLVIKFVFNPTTPGIQNINYNISNNSGSFTGLSFTGKGYNMLPASGQKLFAVSGIQNSGQTVELNKNTGVGSNIGSSNFTDLIGLAIHPETKQIYTIRSSTTGSTLLRVNAGSGDAYDLYSFNLPELFSIAFDSGGTLYGILRGGQLYRINVTDGSYDSITTVNCQRISIAFHPQTNELWGSVKNPVGTPKDQIVKINIITGDTTRIGRTGFNVNTVGLAFDESNQLFGIKGTGTLVSDLFRINQTTGVGTLVGSTGIKDLSALAYSGNFTNLEEDTKTLPVDYILEQNYPNPFNPSTQIKFSLPVNANVKVIIYNLLGQVVKELVNRDLSAGVYTYQWNSDDFSANKVSSGIYFYELKANGINGSKFNQVRKMILLK